MAGGLLCGVSMMQTAGVHGNFGHFQNSSRPTGEKANQNDGDGMADVHEAFCLGSHVDRNFRHLIAACIQNGRRVYSMGRNALSLAWCIVTVAVGSVSQVHARRLGA